MIKDLELSLGQEVGECKGHWVKEADYRKKYKKTMAIMRIEKEPLDVARGRPLVSLSAEVL